VSQSLFSFTIILFNIILYWRTLSYGYVVDDLDWVAKVGRFIRIKPQHFFQSRLYGPGTFLGFPPLATPRADHIITLCLHIITCLLISYVFSPLTAIIFSCHPCAHQTSIWLTGRRYSVLNIIFLTILFTHTYFLFIPLFIILTHHFRGLYLKRRHLPQAPYTFLNILRTIYHSTIKLSGLGGTHPFTPYLFSYQYSEHPHTTCSFIPCTQPGAERYLSIPLIYTCFLLSHIPFILPILICHTYYLMPMYSSIQSFYDYHKLHNPCSTKLPLLRRLYPQIVSTL